MPTDPIEPQNAAPDLYRTVNFGGEIVAGIAGLLGIDVVDGDIGRGNGQNIVARINSWVRKGWEYWPWQELLITEERAFRQIYAEELNYTAGAEVYFIEAGSYFRALEAAAAGESPADAPGKWESFYPLDRFISYTQFGKEWIGQVISVHPVNPITYRRTRDLPFTRSGGGIDVAHGSPNTVWITYRPQQPVFIDQSYDPEKSYTAGNLVFDPDSGDCFRALTATTGDAVTEQDHWYRQLFPYLLAEYVKYGAASELAEDVQTGAMYRAEADDRIVAEINHEAEQIVRRIGYWHGRSWCMPAALIVPIPSACSTAELYL